MSLLISELSEQIILKSSLDPHMKLAILIINGQPFYTIKKFCQKIDCSCCNRHRQEVPENNCQHFLNAFLTHKTKIIRLVFSFYS
jgi:hypothetical protein